MQIRVARLLNRSRHYKNMQKRERMVQRLQMRSLRIKRTKPKRKDRAELVARQKKFRAPVRAED